ncbi:MAG: PAS domain S-box protein [Deltaproteobacteria bacterium]|nr:PAS domain S-box protein [Deltaproteobacteria bacterium]
MPRIMIVDDDVTIQMELMEYLTQMNHNVVGTADNGSMAVDMALDLRPDLILMDVIMPGEIDGISAAQRIKRETSGAVVFITGFGDPEYIDRAKEVEPFGYVMKPFDQKEIRGVIEIVLVRKKLESELKAAHDRLERTNLDLQREIAEHKKTEVALRESELQKRAILDGITTNLAFVNGNLEILWTNKAAANSANRTVGEMIGHKCYELWADSDSPCKDCPTAKAFKTKKTEQSLIHSPDGRVWEEKGEPVFDENGRLIGVLEIAHDITARARAEEALRKSEAHLSTLIQMLPDLVWLKDPDGVYLSCNRRLECLFGAKEDEVVGKTDYDFLDKELADSLRENDRVAVVAGTVSVNEEQIAFAGDGHVEILETLKTPMYDSEGNLIGVLGISRDITDRKRAEEALEASQQRLSQIIDFLPDATMVIDLEGKVIAWNKAMEVMTGIKTEDILGKGNYEYAIPFYGTRQPVLIDLVGKWNKEIEGKYQYVKKEGESLVSETYDPLVKPGSYLQNKASLLYDRNGEPIGAIESIRDITERRVAEAALKESETLQRILLNTLPAGVLVVDPVTRLIERANDHVATLFGASVDHLIGQRCHSLLCPADEGACPVCDLGQAVDNSDREMLRKDGTRLPILKTVKPVLLNGHKKLLECFVDATEQRHAAKLLKFEKERAQQYLDVAGVMLLAMNMDGKVTLANPKGCEILGYPQDEIVGKDWFETFIFPENVEEVGNVFDQIVSGNMDSVRYYENPVRAGDGKKRLIAWNNSVLKDSSGNIVGLFSSGEDITEKNRTEAEREQLRDQLNQVQKMEAIATLAGGIAHDYNNLLSIVMGNLCMVLEDIDRHSVAADFLREAEKASLKARDLTHEFLTLSHGGHPHREKGSIVDLLKEIPEQVRAEKGIECILSIQDGLWPVEYDSKQMRYAISNVFANAVEAMPQGGTITLQAVNQIIDNNRKHCAKPLKKGRYVVVSVIDEGRGISEEHLNQIFDPYFSTKERGVQKGMGLGLAIAYAAIKKHEGHITVNSKTGVGTTVTIYLPAMGGEMKSAPRDDAEAPSAINHHPSSNRRILVMDDEEMLRTLAQMMLNRLGYEAATVKDGDEAIKEYKRKMDSGESFDGVILDLTIKGGMGGEEAIRELLKINPDVKAVVSSGYFNDPVMANYKEHGFRGALAKPYQTADLERVLKEILG